MGECEKVKRFKAVNKTCTVRSVRLNMKLELTVMYENMNMNMRLELTMMYVNMKLELTVMYENMNMKLELTVMYENGVGVWNMRGEVRYDVDHKELKC